MRGATVRGVAGAAALLALAGCGSSATTSSSGPANSPSTSSSSTLITATVAGHGVVLVAGSNSMTLYQFDKDTPGSGTSACTGACLGTWPPLIVAAGTTPSAASGISGQLGTITRSDGAGIQVTYNGRPVHFFSGDSKPGDANGNYPGWSVVAVTSSAAAVSPSSSSSGGYAYP